ncbi:hypothetical protein PENSPDRAFT_664515 [Peniophora sp. CONT]|nr:hypothetical protein PENSPDRAFT_664515 [Peniophora sp. CONT]
MQKKQALVPGTSAARSELKLLRHHDDVKARFARPQDYRRLQTMNSDYGTYGVLRFLKKNDDSIVASYPIDDETLTFGKASDCNIRLYYPAVSQQHAKLIFKERKGFLLIYGGHGVQVDGCTIFPSTSSGETAVPLTNNTVLEISKKRFRFEYPPKPYRAALAAQINTPNANPSRRRTRFSMIQSTEVFSPRPDPDPKVNLRILQSPLRRSPLKKAAQYDDEEEDPPIVLVESNHPRVMEDDQDLVIIEDVPRQEPVAQTPVRATAPLVPRQQQQFTTPRRRPPRNSLHRAVLIRSAQKVALREIAREEEEEQEVDAVEMIIEEGPVEQEDDVQPHGVDEDDDEEEDMDVDEGEEGEEDGDERGRSTGLFSLRRGVEAVRNGLRALSRSLSPEKEPEPEDDQETANHNQEEVQTSAPLVSDIVSASQRAALERPANEFGSPYRSPRPSRESLSLADRVRGSGRVSLAGGLSRSPLKPSQPLAWKGVDDRALSQTSPRRAIQDRRRQSLAAPDAFWAKNGVPGTRSPAKAGGVFPSASEPARIAAPNFGVPISPQRVPATPPPAAPPGLTPFDEFMSPSRAWGASRGAQEPVIEAEEEEPDEMLQRLKMTIGDMKRRKSMRSEEDDARLRALAEKDQNKAEHADTDEDEDDATVEDVPEAGPSTAREATPEIELRHVFARAPATPRISGVRDLHRRADADARVRNAGTPALDGMQEMFSRPSVSRRASEREDIIPSSDDEEARAAAADEHDSESEAEPEPAPAPVRAPARTARLKKSETMPTIARPAAKTAPVRKTASTSRIVVRPGSGRSTPNDELQGESSEPAPTRTRARTATEPKATGAKASGSQQVARSAVKPAKVVERVPRSRKATETDDDAAPVAAKAPAKKPSTRTTKAAPPARSTAAASTRSKKSPSETPDPLDGSSDEDDEPAPVASRVRQRHATGSSEQDGDDDKPRTRRTPARAAARKPAAAPTRKTAARKAAPEKENTPDRVKEEDEEEPTPPPPPPPARTTTRRTAVRKADVGGQSEPERDTQTKARAPRTRAATRG